MPSKNLLVLVLVTFFALLFLGWSSGAENQEEFLKVIPLSSQGTFNLKNINGKVSISTWKEANVEIKALKKTNKEAENLQKVKIEVTAAADSVSVDTVYPKLGNTGVSVDYDIRVPEGVNLGEVSTVNGNVGITGPFGRVSASTTNGGIQVESASGNLELETTNGDVKAINVTGPIDAHTTNGSINAMLEAETVNGSITFDIPVTLQSLDKSRHHLRGQIGQGGPQISLETTNGSIHLTR
jgi:DUF4097 and DUF4098 domain-containing protein YvlB